MTNQQNSLVIFCGMFSYFDSDVKIMLSEKKFEDFEDFFERDSAIKVLQQVFYPNFSNVIISKKCHIHSQTCGCLFRHLIRDNPSELNDLELRGDSIAARKFSISKIDIFLFPEVISKSQNEKLGIYTFHVKLFEKLEFDELSSFINRIRLFESSNYIKMGEQQSSTLDFIKKCVLNYEFSHDIVKNIMGNKLKTFTIVCTEQKAENVNQLLVDVGTAQLSHTNGKEHNTKNSEEMSRELIESNLISMYSNWKALALFDSFTVIGTDLGDLSKTWGTTYLLIYIHCLKMKFYFFYINSELSNFQGFKAKTEKLRTKFIEFISCNNLFSISFNILPNKIYRSIHYSLDLQNEVEELEKKITNMNRIINEQNDKRLNRLIFLLALLGVVSVIFHASEFLMRIFSVKEHYYPHLGLSITGTIIIIVATYFLSLRKNK